MKGCLSAFIIFISCAILIIGGINYLGLQPNGYGKDDVGEFIYRDSCITYKLDTIHRFTGRFWIHHEITICDSSVVVKEYFDN